MMKIENQVCSLEQAKKLKELGVIQNNGLFQWSEYDGLPPMLFDFDGRYIGNYPAPEILRTSEYKGCYVAFTVAELGVMLPTGYDTMQNTIDGWRGYDDSGCDMPPYDTIRMKHVEGYNTEAECRGAMLIYLLESNLITAQEVNERL